MKRSTIITGRMTKAVKTSSLSKLIYRFSGIRSEILAGFFLMATDKLIFKNSHVSANEQALPSVKGELTDLHWDSGLFTKAQPWQQCKNGSVTRAIFCDLDTRSQRHHRDARAQGGLPSKWSWRN